MARAINRLDISQWYKHAYCIDCFYPLHAAHSAIPLAPTYARELQEYAVRKMDGVNLEGSRISVEFAKETPARGGGGRGGDGYRLVAEGLSAYTSWQDLKVLAMSFMLSIARLTFRLCG